MDNTMQINKRSERRIPLEMITMPFLATRDENQQSFEYLLVDVSPSGAKFVLPQWAVSRERLEMDAVINLHLSLVHEGSSFAKGKVVWRRWDETAYAELCAVSLFQKMPIHSPFAISAEHAEIVVDMESIESLPAYLARTIRDCSLLKKGVAIYLKHLIPYFSRIGNYPETDYPLLRDTVLDEIRQHVLTNHDKLNNLCRNFAEHCKENEDIPKRLNLEELRAMVDSEISADIFAATFESGKTAIYISAIKELEKKLYSNFNVAVMIYLLAL